MWQSPISEISTTYERHCEALVACSNENSRAIPFSLFFLDSEHLYVPRFYAVENALPGGASLNIGTDLTRCAHLSQRMTEFECEVSASVQKTLLDHSGAILNAYRTSLKTLVSLRAISLIRKRTIIFVPQILMKRWELSIEQQLPSCKIGKIGKLGSDVADSDVVLTTYQNFLRRDDDIDGDTMATFGFAIFDGCERVSGRLLANAMMRVSALRVLGLTTSMNAQSEIYEMIQWFLGRTIVNGDGRGKYSHDYKVLGFVF